VFTRSLQLFVTWARWVQFVPLHSIPLRSILILSCHLHQGFPSDTLPSDFAAKIPYAFLFYIANYDLQTELISTMFMRNINIKISHPLHISPIFTHVLATEPITMAAQSKAWIMTFSRSNAGILDSNPTQGMDMCVLLFCVCVVLCVGSGLATGWSLAHGVLPSV
jgi:hypothetical protein